MRKLLALVVLLALAAPAFGADNTLLVTPCAAGCITTKSKDIGAGVQAPQPVLSDASGNVLAMPTAGADAVSNTATGLQGYTYPFWFNGVTWDRARGDATNGAFVNVKTSVLPTGAATAANQAIVNTWAGGTLGAMANYGTSPGAVLVPGVNAFVTNALTPGQATMANSSPIVPASNWINDPCWATNTKTNFAIATASGTLQLVAPSGSTQVYICSLSVIAAATAVINVVGGTGATCTTGTPVALMGSTTAASGMSLAANGGLTFGNGAGTVARTTTGGHGVCLIQSGTTALAGSITYVQQ